MAVNYKNPPEMREDLLYADWKTELEIWRSFTDLAKAKQGPAVFLSLMGKARQTALAEVKPADLAKDTGVDTILNTLDKLYVKDVCDAAYSAFGNFCKFKRPDHMSVSDYMAEFNLRLCKIKSYNMNLPDNVLAYYLLDCVNLSDEQTSLCRATCVKLTYADMKTQIERVAISNPNPAPARREAVNVEPQYVAHDNEYQDYYDEQYDEDYNENESHDTTVDDAYYSQPGTWSRTSQQHQTMNKKGRKNPLDEFGNPAPCRFCKSIYHWVDACPDAPASVKSTRGSNRGYMRRNTRGRARGSTYRGSYNPQRQF